MLKGKTIPEKKNLHNNNIATATNPTCHKDDYKCFVSYQSKHVAIIPYDVFVLSSSYVKTNCSQQNEKERRK